MKSGTAKQLEAGGPSGIGANKTTHQPGLGDTHADCWRGDHMRQAGAKSSDLESPYCIFTGEDLESLGTS